MQWGWAYDGVNTSVPRNAGPECASYLTIQRHFIECIFVLAIGVFSLKWGITNASPLHHAVTTKYFMPTGQKLLLIGMTFSLGLELGFKLSQRSLIYILNPCHITSIIQVSHLINNQ